MKILFLAWRDLANELAGGSEVLIDELCRGMTARGHDVTLMCAEPVSTEHPYKVHPNGRTVDQYLRAPFAYLRHHRDADLVVDVANGVSYYTPFWRRKPTVCFVNHIHTEQWDQWFPKPIAFVGRNLETHGMPAAYRNRLFVAVSPSTADNLVAMGVDRERIRIIINGTHLPPAPGSEAPEPLFVGLGRLVPHKRFEIAVRAFNEIRPEIGGRLLIAGDGPERARIEAIAGPGVEILGRVTEQEKHDLLRHAWLMVHPASHEGWGLVITEAAGYGTPSLAFRVPGLMDSIVHGMSGLLVDEPHELAETWKRIAQDPALRARLRAGALRRAAACTWEATVDRFEEICEEAVLSHRRSLHLPAGSWTGPDDAVSVEQLEGPIDAPPQERSPELAGIPAGTGRPTLRVVREQPDLSIIIPAFNEAARLPVALPILLDHLARRDGTTEVIVVDDGSTDATVEVGAALLADVPRAGIFSLGRHAGKGAAVRAGVARATGAQIVFMDADMATDLDFLDPLLASLDHAHVAVGSRSAPGAVTSGVTPSSDAAHRVFNVLARTVTGLPITDFQCGFKAFRGSSGKLLFHLLREKGYAFDVELLTLADRLGLSIHEVPVHWKAVRGSHVRIVVDSVLMTYQVARITQRTRQGQKLSAIEVAGNGQAPDELAALVRGHLPLHAPVLARDGGALALLPFVEPVDSSLLASALERQLHDVAGVAVRSTTVDTGTILAPQAHGMRSALAAS